MMSQSLTSICRIWMGTYTVIMWQCCDLLIFNLIKCSSQGWNTSFYVKRGWSILEVPKAIIGQISILVAIKATMVFWMKLIFSLFCLKALMLSVYWFIGYNSYAQATWEHGQDCGSPCKNETFLNSRVKRCSWGSPTDEGNFPKAC